MTVRFTAVERVDDDLRTAMLACWVAVSDAGGAVGFLPPADPAAVAAVLDAEAAEVSTGRRWLGVVADDGGVLVGFGFVVPQSGPVVGHRGTVLRLQVHPDHQGTGAGGTLLEGLHRLARDRGLTQLTLFHRSGTGVGGFYRRHGYVEVGRWPHTLRVAADDWRDDVWMARDL